MKYSKTSSKNMMDILNASNDVYRESNRMDEIIIPEKGYTLNVYREIRDEIIIELYLLGESKKDILSIITDIEIRQLERIVEDCERYPEDMFEFIDAESEIESLYDQYYEALANKNEQMNLASIKDDLSLDYATTVNIHRKMGDD